MPLSALSGLVLLHTELLAIPALQAHIDCPVRRRLAVARRNDTLLSAKQYDILACADRAYLTAGRTTRASYDRRA